MNRGLRRALAVVPAAALAVGGWANPAGAQFEPAIPRTEAHDAIDIAVTPDGQEWWVAETDGQVATAPLGDAQVTCPPPSELRGYIRTIDRTPSGEGYWLATTYGRVLTCGDAEHFGDLPSQGITPNEPIVGIAATPDGQGYWLAASDGGVFSYGNASFQGSAGDIDLNEPIVGIESAGEDDGYWLVATDGGVFTYGDASFHGSAGDIDLNKPVVDMTRSPNGGGYYLLAEDGGVFTYGDATFRGSRYTLEGSSGLTAPFVGIEFAWGRDGYFMTDSGGIVQSFATDRPHRDEIETTSGFPGTGPAAWLRDVRMAGHPTMDRFVLEFTNRLPEYRVRYVEGPIREQPSGRSIDVAGQRFIEVSMAAASGVDRTGAQPRETYTGPERISAAGTSIMTEAVQTEDFEHHLSWVVGLDERSGVEVFTLQNPPRLVVDVQHQR